ncbi:hypothetical protein FRC11_005528, partial [Ceratobasidium sp. 423]
AALLAFAKGCCEEFRLSDMVREDVMHTAGWHMRENPTLYDIPQVVQERLLTTKKFSSAVGEIHHKHKTDIASTGKKLTIQGFQVSKDHLKHFALLIVTTI